MTKRRNNNKKHFRTTINNGLTIEEMHKRIPVVPMYFYYADASKEEKDIRLWIQNKYDTTIPECWWCKYKKRLKKIRSNYGYIIFCKKCQKKLMKEEKVVVELVN